MNTNINVIEGNPTKKFFIEMIKYMTKIYILLIVM